MMKWNLIKQGKIRWIYSPWVGDICPQCRSGSLGAVKVGMFACVLYKCNDGVYLCVSVRVCVYVCWIIHFSSGGSVQALLLEFVNPTYIWGVTKKHNVVVTRLGVVQPGCGEPICPPSIHRWEKTHEKRAATATSTCMKSREWCPLCYIVDYYNNYIW